jgi:hypothetical protein
MALFSSFPRRRESSCLNALVVQKDLDARLRGHDETEELRTYSTRRFPAAAMMR